MNTATVLICDDEIHIRRVVGERLRSAGMTVLEAEDGLDGFELAREHSPDIIISDLQMPTMSGAELCRRLRENAPTAGVPVILLTARGYLLKESQSELSNVRAIVQKPFSVRDVLERVNAILTERAGGGAQAA